MFYRKLCTDIDSVASGPQTYKGQFPNPDQASSPTKNLSKLL